MNTQIEEKVKTFSIMNDISLKGEIVVFGSSYTANFPFYELSSRYVMSNALYNRSIDSLSLKDACDVVTPCVIDLKPAKVFLSFGENDFDSPTAIADYEKLIRKINSALPHCSVFVLSARGGRNNGFNDALVSLCRKVGAKYVTLDFGDGEDAQQYKKIYKELSCFFRTKAITFDEAFALSRC